MIKESMTLNEIQQAGLAARSRELGPVGFVRFLQMFVREGMVTILRSVLVGWRSSLLTLS